MLTCIHIAKCCLAKKKGRYAYEIFSFFYSWEFCMCLIVFIRLAPKCKITLSINMMNDEMNHIFFLFTLPLFIVHCLVNGVGVRRFMMYMNHLAFRSSVDHGNAQFLLFIIIEQTNQPKRRQNIMKRIMYMLLM